MPTPWAWDNPRVVAVRTVARTAMARSPCKESPKRSASSSPRSNAVPPRESHMEGSSSSETPSTPFSPDRSSVRPSLFDHNSTPMALHLAHAPHSFDRDDEGLPPKRPRRLWRVSDTQLPKLPFMYPPLCAQTSRTIRHTPPSIVAIRIAECLRLRSITVEYDEESASALCMTVDRCHFQIQLWRATAASFYTGGSTGSAHRLDTSGTSPLTSGSDAVVVDCLRVRGPLLTFHRTVHALLEAADSLDTGANMPPAVTSSATEFARLTQPVNLAAGTLVSAQDVSLQHQYSDALDALEHVLSMLRKDRIEAQELGMEYLVSLTDLEVTAPDTAMYCAMAVLGAPVTSGVQQTAVFLRELHKEWIMGLMVDRIMPGEQVASEVLVEPAARASALSCASSLLGDGSRRTKQSSHESMPPVNTPTVAVETFGDEHHGGKMRSMALRAFTNSLIVLESKQLLPRILASQAPHLVAPTLLRALVDDVHGALRHLSVATGTRLASQHEAVLAIRCLRLLATYSTRAEQVIVTEHTMELLDKARSVGESNHVILADEANRAYLQLTEDFRSC